MANPWTKAQREAVRAFLGEAMPNNAGILVENIEDFMPIGFRVGFEKIFESLNPVGVRVDALGLPEVAGVMMDRTINDFVRACRTLLRDEQEKIAPDSALIGVLCDAVRLTREFERVSGKV